MIIIKLRWALSVTYTIIQSITSSEMCSLHLTHTSAHTPGAVGGGVRCLAQGSHLSRGQYLPEPRFDPTTSGYKSDALSTRPRLPPGCNCVCSVSGVLRRAGVSDPWSDEEGEKPGQFACAAADRWLHDHQRPHHVPRRPAGRNGGPQHEWVWDCPVLPCLFYIYIYLFSILLFLVSVKSCNFFFF